MYSATSKSQLVRWSICPPGRMWLGLPWNPVDLKSPDLAPEAKFSVEAVKPLSFSV